MKPITTRHVITAKNVEIYTSPFFTYHKFRNRTSDLEVTPNMFAQEPGYRATDVHQPQSSDRSDRIVDHGLAEVRRCPECGSHRVPDEPGALPQDSLPSRHLRTRHQVIQLFFFFFFADKSVLAMHFLRFERWLESNSSHLSTVHSRPSLSGLFIVKAVLQ
jgi:hypothetical protein